MKKIIFGITAIIIVAGIGLFVSCDKTDDTATKNVTNIMAKERHEMVTLAIIESPKDNLEPILLFCIDSIENQINDTLYKYYGSCYTFNDISIYDDNPLSPTSSPFLEFSITDVKNGESMTGFMPILKDTDDSSGSIVYYATGEERVRIRCKGKNCDGCTLNAAKTGCDPCTNNGGECKTKVSYSSGPSLLEALDRIADKIIEIIKSIK